MRILVLSGMHPLPTNVARGTFVADHVRLLRDANHDVRVVNPSEDAAVPRITTLDLGRRGKAPRSTPSTELKCSCRGIGASPIRLLRG